MVKERNYNPSVRKKNCLLAVLEFIKDEEKEESLQNEGWAEDVEED